MGFGFLLYLLWEAMLISYLAQRVSEIPFKDISTLVTKTDFKIALRQGTSFEDAFKTATDPFWQKAWIDRVEPFLQDYRPYFGTSTRITTLGYCTVTLNDCFMSYLVILLTTL